jgi:hypothetical protein
MVTLWKSPPNGATDLFEPFEFLPHPPIPLPTDSGILDGQQRLTSILNIFGGARPTHGNSLLKVRWYYRFDSCPAEERVVFLKDAEATSRGLTSRGACISAGFFPLADFEDVAEYLADLKDTSHYAGATLPPDIDERVENLKKILHSIENFRLPVYVLPSTLGLNEVCEIFEYLNTTGTKVGVFDIVHTKLFPQGFNLRDWYDSCSQSQTLQHLQGWCRDKNRPQWLNQAVTATWLRRPENRSRSGSWVIQSYKAKDLIDTPLSAYQAAKTGQSTIDRQLGAFARLTGSVRTLSRCPYPILAANYLGLRKMASPGGDLASVPVDEIDAGFVAYYWRVVLNERYNQGFLTGAVKDLDALSAAFLVAPGGRTTNSAMWVSEFNRALDTQVSKPVGSVELRAIVSDPDLAGARRLGYRGLVYLAGPRDLKTGDPLDAQDDVEMHHIFPKAWVKNNISSKADRGKVDCVANLVPLTTDSNGEWLANSPKVALGTWRRDSWVRASDIAESILINEKAFDALRRNRFVPFLKERTNLLVRSWERLQRVGS